MNGMDAALSRRRRRAGIWNIHCATIIATLLSCVAWGCGNGSSSGVDGQRRLMRSDALVVELESRPPVLRFFDTTGRLVTESEAGIVQIVAVSQKETWFEAFLAVERNEEDVVEFDTGYAALDFDQGQAVISLFDERGELRAHLTLAQAEEGSIRICAEVAGVPLLPDRETEIHVRFRARHDEYFYGFGGQTDAAEHRGHIVPIRVTEQGLTKDPRLAESEWSIAGHVHDAYFPLPYTIVARPDPDHAAYGLILDTNRRSRFLLCAERDDLLELQAQLEPEAGGGHRQCCLYVLPGPHPADVVRRYTAMQGRQVPLPRWAFGPWIAIKGLPLEVASLARAIEAQDVAATAVWDQDWRDYEHPDLPEMVARLHAIGLRVLTYFNTFLDSWELKDPEEPIRRGFASKRQRGGPYRFLRVLTPSSILDLTNPEARQWMAGRLARAYRLGIDGWMADYGEWVAPDMVFHDGRMGRDYANRYCVDWAALNDEVAKAERPDGSAVFFSRSGYLGSNGYVRVVWAGDQQTDWDMLDGLASVIPYGTSLGLAGISAYGFDIAGYTGTISPPSTKELYLRWLALGALSPVMRTHRGNNWEKNWNWDRDAETISQFRRYSILHLRLLPYLEALHDESVRSGLPAMRHVLLEFPGWEGAPRADHVYMLGPSLFVAPVIHQGVSTLDVELPPGTWYRWETGEALVGPRVVTVSAPLGDIPVFLRAGGIVPLLPDSVRRIEKVEGRPLEWSVEAEESRLIEIDIGGEAQGRMTLRDGTTVTVVVREEPAGAGTTVRLLEDNRDLPHCELGMDPRKDPCWTTDLGTSAVVARRRGPGTIFFGRTVAGHDTWVQIVGGPAERDVVIRLFHTSLDDAR